MAWHVPSGHADAVETEYRLFAAQLEATRAGRWDEARRLIAEWVRAQQRRRELA
jgi:hypothetical protein